MIWPGVKRPPPMGSELVSKLLGGVGRGVRGEEGEEGGLRGVEAAGTNVSPSPRASSPISVVPVSGSRGAPQEEQNLLLGETCAPHFEQNMGGRNSITGSRLIVNRANGSGDALHLNSSAVRQHFGDSLHYFGGVIAHADHCVCAVIGGVLEQQFESIFTSFLAEICEDGDVSADDGLERGAQIADDAARAHDNPADNSKISDHAIAWQFEGGRNHTGIHSGHVCSPWTDVYRCDSNR